MRKGIKCIIYCAQCMRTGQINEIMLTIGEVELNASTLLCANDCLSVHAEQSKI